MASRIAVLGFRTAPHAVGSRPAAVLCLFSRKAGFSSSLDGKVDQFKSAISQHLPKDGKGAVFATAWLATDNVFVALMKNHFPEV